MLEHLHPTSVAAIAPAIGGLIQTERARAKLSTADVARRCGVARHTVVDWEDGRELPRPQQWKRLQGTLRRLPVLSALRAWISEQMDRLSAGREVAVVAGPTSPMWLATDLAAADATTPETEPAAPAPAPESPPSPPPPPSVAIVRAHEPAPALPQTTLLDRYQSFGAGLRALREHARCEQWVIGELIGVEQSTISAWERDAVAPIYQHLLRLYDLFPELPRLAPPPPSRDIPKPRGPEGLTFVGHDEDEDEAPPGPSSADAIDACAAPDSAAAPVLAPAAAIPLPDAPDGLDLLVRALPICEHLWGGPFRAMLARAGGEVEVEVSNGGGVLVGGRGSSPRLALAGVLGRIRGELSRRRSELDAMSAAIGGGEVASDSDVEEGSDP